MSIAEDKPKSVTLRDAQGNVIPTDLPADADEQATRAWVITSICKVGGLFGVAEEPKGDTVTAVIYKPKSDDEGADLNELCTPPTSYLAQAPDADPAQQTMIAAAYYEGSLASPKWRSWHLDTSKELAQTEDPSAKKSIKAKRVELDRAAKAAGKTTCWWATMLNP